MTFVWIYNADLAFGHNVNHWFEGTTELQKQNAREVWEGCSFNETAHPFYNLAQHPNFIFDTSSVELGLHFFACGLGYGEDYPQNAFHCNRGVKAQILVVSNPSECDSHVY